MRVTKHAAERWGERFPDLDIANEYASARRVGKKTKRKIKERCKAHKQYLDSTFRGRYVLMNKRKIIFVMVPPETVITVFRLEAL